MKRRPRLSYGFSALLLVIAALFAFRFYPRAPLSSRIPVSTAVFAADGQLLRLTLASDQQYRLWTPIDRISPELVDALLLHEDRSFYRHLGVNPVALVRAGIETYGGGARQGGSTITMQLARLLYDIDTRTVPGKLEQIAYALGLEARYSKRELLEAHLNLMPYGGNVQGVGAASLIYFDKPARALGLSEALTLVLIPQSPARRDPAHDEPAELRRARLRLFERWREAHPEEVRQAQYLDMALRYRGPKEMPFLAPHATQSLLAHAGADIHSTLQLPLQTLAEDVIHNYIAEHADVGIHNAAALLLDYRDMSVRAVVGSADFFDASIEGQVNGTLAKRSPGSALKPFIYALAIDQGLIHAATVLKDAPTAFGAFSPENFDGAFVGPINATEALTRSRNVPAVAISAHLSEPTLYGFLKSAGISRMASERHYGLALALGGGEVTMEEVAALYAMLANRGVLRAARYRVDQPTDVGARLLSEEASFMVLDMLRSAPRPDESSTSRRYNVPVAWKTGTSWGFRDAWTAGVFGPYVLVVWTGNFDGRGNPVFVGVQAAAPLFFRLYDAILARDPRLQEPVFRQPPRLARVEVCRESGDLPNADCPHVVSTWYIPGTSPIKVSQIHRRVWIDTRTGRQVCPPYDMRFVRPEVFEFWPSDLLQLFEQAGMPRRRPPDTIACQRDGAGIAPQITSPVLGATYTVRTSVAEQSRVPLSANVDSEVRRVHWFVDNAYLGASAPGVALAWQPSHSGRYMLRAVDDRGRADSRMLVVEVVQ